MIIQSSIIAGQILSFLEEKNRAVSFKELVYFLEQPLALIEAGVEKLVKEGLAVLDVEKHEVKVEAIPKFVNKEVEVKQRFFKKMAGV